MHNKAFDVAQNRAQEGFMVAYARFFGALWKRLLRNDSAGLAAEMSYNWMLSLLPTLIFIFSLFGLVGAKTNLFSQLLLSLQRLIPPGAFELVTDTLNELTRASSGGLALVSLAGALWTASNGATALEKALNRSIRGGGKRRSFWAQRMVALQVVLGLTVLLFVSANLVVFGELLLNGLPHWLPLPARLLGWLGFVRWGLAIVCLVGISGFIYFVVPQTGRNQPRRSVWRGALTFVGLWILLSWLFSLYVTNMGTYNRVYGSMGAIIVLMVWFYFTSFALLVGGEVNAICSGSGGNRPSPARFPRRMRRARL